MTEAGGVVAAAHADLVSVSGLVAAASSLAVPAAHVAVHATTNRLEARRKIRKSSFYFLHAVEHAAR